MSVFHRMLVSSFLVLGLSLNYSVSNASSREGFMLGGNYSIHGGSDFAVQVGYLNDFFWGDVGFNYEHISINAMGGADFSIYELRTHLGLRKALIKNYYFEYGVTGSYGFRGQTPPGVVLVNPYNVGLYTGLSYQPIEHLVLAARISPYSYAKRVNQDNHNYVFSEGSIAVAYVFS